MRDLHLTGVHEDGEHLLLRDDAGEEFRLRLDEPLRTAARREHRSVSPGASKPPALGPREVQAMIRAGASAEEAAAAAGWTVEKVHRYDGPILAEREHIAYLAGNARLRGRGSEHATTLRERVEQRLTERGVEPTSALWDSWRSEDGQWTVEVTFAAGGRARTGAWRFNRASVAVQAVDDEARWLSGDADRSPTSESASGGSAVRSRPAQGAPASSAAEAAPTDSTAPSRAAADEAAAGRADDGRDAGDEGDTGLGVPHEEDETFDLAMSVRRHSRAQHRRGSRRQDARAAREAAETSPSAVPSPGPWPGDQALPLADLRYDPETMPPPPAAHADPDPTGVDGRPEPAAAAAASSARPGAGKAPRKPARAPRARKTSAPPPAQARAAKAASDSGPSDSGPSGGDQEKAAAVSPDPSRPASARTPAPPRPAAAQTPEPAPESATARPAAPSPARSRPASARPAAPPSGAAPGSAFGAITPANEGQDPAAGTEPRPRKSTKARGRASVPSWDDIMFGTRGPR